MAEEYRPLSSEEIERIKVRLDIAGPPDRSRNATAMDWYALDVGRLLVTIAAKDAEIERKHSLVPDEVAAAARAIALHLAPYCDGALPFYEMIAEASRRANARIAALSRELAIKDALIGRPAPEAETYSTSSFPPDSPIRYKTPAVPAYPVKLTIIECEPTMPRRIPHYDLEGGDADRGPVDPCADDHDE